MGDKVNHTGGGSTLCRTSGSSDNAQQSQLMTHINKATTPVTPSNACLLPERCVHVLYGHHFWKNWLGSGNGDAACSV